MPGCLDPWRAIDREPDPESYVQFLETRGRAPDQRRLRRRFLRFAGIRPGWRVVDVGAGTGVLSRDLARLVGVRGEVVALDRSRTLIVAGRRLARQAGLAGRVRFRLAEAAALPFPDGRFDAALAMTLLLHVPEPEPVLRELRRVVRPDGVVGVLDQDLGTLALDHSQPELTRRILDRVAARVVVRPWSGRGLYAQLVRLGLRRVRTCTEVYCDRSYSPFARNLLQRRAREAVRLGFVGAASARGWLAELEERAASGTFLMTMNFYGAVGRGPTAPASRPGRERP